MTGKINFSNLVRQLLPHHKRQPRRIRWLAALASPLQQTHDEFESWRRNIRLLLNVNSQKKILEEYLRRLFDREDIYIVNYRNNLPLVSLRAEGLSRRLRSGLRTEIARAAVPFRGEVRQLFGDAHFLVYAPYDIDMHLLEAEVERLRQALINYKIILTDTEQ